MRGKKAYTLSRGSLARWVRAHSTKPEKMSNEADDKLWPRLAAAVFLKATQVAMRKEAGNEPFLRE